MLGETCLVLDCGQLGEIDVDVEYEIDTLNDRLTLTRVRAALEYKKVIDGKTYDCRVDVSDAVNELCFSHIYDLIADNPDTWPKPKGVLR